jgi:hypothetical protein
VSTNQLLLQLRFLKAVFSRCPHRGNLQNNVTFSGISRILFDPFPIAFFCSPLISLCRCFSLNPTQLLATAGASQAHSFAFSSLFFPAFLHLTYLFFLASLVHLVLASS